MWLRQEHPFNFNPTQRTVHSGGGLHGMSLNYSPSHGIWFRTGLTVFGFDSVFDLLWINQHLNSLAQRVAEPTAESLNEIKATKLGQQPSVF
jgi:hypothetical protein